MEKDIRQKHYNRFEKFVTYDIEEREIDEQKIILEEIIRVANDMLKELNNK
ncbi:hypothetical protein HBE96_00355 [Clostridium sp. P21]|uniref:Uncharacterized protein n=1 Tax=Clostridium muellerianum TaxID=2716538 RepID=A0A7Y0ECZ7_9CLOT|nr:hypothetical protein [Clostridium muellerianum]NMM61178.1 hypothetical protein [Clostridium muellerianum]